MPLASRLSLLLFLSFLLIHESLAEIVCEDLPKDVCAFSIASSGKRCVLETIRVRKLGNVEYECQTSEVVVESMSDYIETDQCIRACGVDRKCVGISSDALLEPQFTVRLCSPLCYQRCPNIVDLYFNLAAGEGMSLSDMCEKHRRNRRAMAELMSYGGAISEPPSIASPPLAFAASLLSQSDDVRSSSAPAPSPYIPF